MNHRGRPLVPLRLAYRVLPAPRVKLRISSTRTNTSLRANFPSVAAGEARILRTRHHELEARFPSFRADRHVPERVEIASTTRPATPHHEWRDATDRRSSRSQPALSSSSKAVVAAPAEHLRSLRSRAVEPDVNVVLVPSGGVATLVIDDPRVPCFHKHSHSASERGISAVRRTRIANRRGRPVPARYPIGWIHRRRAWLPTGDASCLREPMNDSMACSPDCPKRRSRRVLGRDVSITTSRPADLAKREVRVRYGCSSTAGSHAMYSPLHSHTSAHPKVGGGTRNLSQLFARYAEHPCGWAVPRVCRHTRDGPTT